MPSVSERLILRKMKQALWLTALTYPLTFGAEGPANFNAERRSSERLLGLGRPGFVMPEAYNSFDHDGVAIGLLERETYMLDFELRRLSAGRATAGDSLSLGSTFAQLPQIGFHIPGTFSVMSYYQRVDEFQDRVGGDRVDVARNRFGLDFAAGATSRIFQFGLSLHGGLGGINNQLDRRRFQLEINDVRLSAATQVHPAARAGGHFGASAFLDTLQDAGSQIDRYPIVDFPRWGLFVDAGDSALFPAWGNMGYERGEERFWGRHKGGLTETAYDRVWTTWSVFRSQAQYQWQRDDWSLAPAITLGLSARESQRYEDDGTLDRFALSAKGDALGAPWTYSGVRFGLGGQAAYKGWGIGLLEWERLGLSLEGEDVVNERDAAFNRFLVGFETNVHALPWSSWPEQVAMALRLSYSGGTESPQFPWFRPRQFERYNSGFAANSQRARTEPVLAAPQDWSSVNLGLGLELWSKVGLDLHLGFQNREETADNSSSLVPASGTEWGVTLKYHVR